jgi:hypothetical protein
MSDPISCRFRISQGILVVVMAASACWGQGPQQGRHEGLALPEHANGTLSVAIVPTSAGTISPSGLYTAPAVSPSPANVIVTMATVTIGSAPAFYVSTTGNDNNDGYSGSPWRTIQHLEQYIRGGAEFEEVAI